MKQESNSTDVDLFISYASRDRERVLEIAGRLESAGVRLWIDRHRIEGGTNYGPAIVRGIKGCKVFMLICSNASLRSRNVKQEIQLAWKYERPYLPLLLEPVSFPEQVEYWMEGWQWVEVLGLSPEQWLPPVLRALAHAGVQSPEVEFGAVQAGPVVRPIRPVQGLEGIWSVASFTDQIWPVPADRVRRGLTRSTLRDLGASQEDVQHGHRLGSRVCLAIESEREGHLLLLNRGDDRKDLLPLPVVVCPRYAPAGRSELPAAGGLALRLVFAHRQPRSGAPPGHHRR